MQAALGINTRVISPKEVRDLEPSLSIEGVGAAAYEPDSGYADPTSVATGFARRAGELGARICQGIEVTGVELSGGRAQGVQTAQGTIAAPIVVLACGPWSPAFARRLGIELPVRVKRVIEIYVRRPPGLKHRVVVDGVSGTYFRPEGSDVSLLGGRSDDWGTDPDNYNEVAGPEIVEPAIKRAVERLPAFAQAGLMRGVAGVDGYSDDFHQILGRVPGFEGLYLAAGGSGTAFKKSPAIGKCLAELILEGQARTVDLRPFRLERFAEDDPLRGQYEYAVLEGLGSRLV
jgi:sarcosine oxidase subunit beta